MVVLCMNQIPLSENFTIEKCPELQLDVSQKHPPRNVSNLGHVNEPDIRSCSH